MSDAASKPRWYHITPERFLIGLLVAVLLLLLADRFELVGLTRGSGWSVLLALAIVCLGMFGGLIWFGASLLLRRRFQFSLKSLLVFTVIVAILCSWFAVKIQQANRQKEAVKAIERLGGTVWYDHEIECRDRFQGPPPENAASAFAAWCRNVLGTDFLSPVTVVEWFDTQVNNAGLMHLKELTSLKWLSLEGTDVTDAELAELKELKNLVLLDLSDTEVSDAGLVHLEKLTNLKWLELDGTHVTDAGLVHLKKLTSLKSLVLIDTQVTLAGFYKLKQALNCDILYNPRR